MKKRLQKILSELVGDYEVARNNFDTLEDITQQEVSIQAMANTLVLIQTQLNNLSLYEQYLTLETERKGK